MVDVEAEVVVVVVVVVNLQMVVTVVLMVDMEVVMVKDTHRIKKMDCIVLICCLPTVFLQWKDLFLVARFILQPLKDYSKASRPLLKNNTSDNTDNIDNLKYTHQIL